MALNKSQLIRGIKDFQTDGDAAKLANAIDEYIKSGQIIFNPPPQAVVGTAGPAPVVAQTVPIPFVIALGSSIS